MSSKLQLDVRNLSLGRRHLVNAYKIKVKRCDPCLSALRVLQKIERDIKTLTFTFCLFKSITLMRNMRHVGRYSD